MRWRQNTCPAGYTVLRANVLSVGFFRLRRHRQGRSLAISLDPHGGSPTGQPTGPVVYQTQLVDL